MKKTAVDEKIVCPFCENEKTGVLTDEGVDTCLNERCGRSGTKTEFEFQRKMSKRCPYCDSVEITIDFAHYIVCRNCTASGLLTRCTGCHKAFLRRSSQCAESESIYRCVECNGTADWAGRRRESAQSSAKERV